MSNKTEEDKSTNLETYISCILSEISGNNENVSFNPDDPYSTEKPSKVKLSYYFERIKKYTKIENSTLIIILIYVDRMCTLSGIILNPHNIHRIILGCLLIAIKYNEDVYYTNMHYANVGGISLEELNCLEYYTIQLLNFDLYISDEIYQKYVKYVQNYQISKR